MHAFLLVACLLGAASAVWYGISRQSPPARREPAAAAPAPARVEEPLPPVSAAESDAAQRMLQERLEFFYSIPSYISVSPRTRPSRRGLVGPVEVTTSYVLHSDKGERLIRMENATKKGERLELRFVALTIPTGQWVLVGDTAILDRSVAEGVDEELKGAAPGLLEENESRSRSSTGVRCHVRTATLGPWECAVFTTIQPANPLGPGGAAAASRGPHRSEYWFAPDGFLVRTRRLSPAGVAISDRAVTEYRIAPAVDPGLFTVPADASLVVASSRPELRQQIILAMKKNNEAKNKPRPTS